jgi:hypothetical protein
VRLAELRSGAAEERVDVLLALGRHEEIVPDLTGWFAEFGVPDELTITVRDGRQAGALARCPR